MWDSLLNMVKFEERKIKFSLYVYWYEYKVSLG